MKTMKLIAITMLVFAGLFTAPLWAEAVTVAEGITVSVSDGKFELAAALITLITPIIIWGIKKAAPHIPTAWLPIIAPVLGAGLAVLAHFTAGIEVNWWQGVLLGSAGVGLRELDDQSKQVISPPPM
jgi:hypothetical protein